MGIEVVGAENFTKLAAELAKLAASMETQLQTAVERAVQPLRQDIPSSARATLPRRGGLNQRIAASSISIRRGRGSLSVITSNGYQIQNIDRGQVRHPVYGNRGRWVSQTVSPNWWTKPITKAMPKIRRDVDRELQRILDQVGG